MQPPKDLKEAVERAVYVLNDRLVKVPDEPLTINDSIGIILTELAPLWEKMERKIAWLQANVTPVDWKRAFELAKVETTEVLEQAPELLQRLFKERDTLKSENENLKSSITFGKELEQENEKLKAENGRLEQLHIRRDDIVAKKSIEFDTLNKELSTLRQLCNELALQLNIASIGSCNCLTKTPNWEFHAESCQYKGYGKALTKYNSTKGKQE